MNADQFIEAHGYDPNGVTKTLSLEVHGKSGPGWSVSLVAPNGERLAQTLPPGAFSPAFEPPAPSPAKPGSGVEEV